MIPIGFDIPNPFAPFVLPSIHINIARVSIPAQALSSIVVTIIFGSVGLAPLIETLNTTATSLRGDEERARRGARRRSRATSAQEMRQDLQAARPGTQLGVDVLDPQPAAVAPSSGTIAFRITGANLSFVDPVGAGLPQQAISRVQVMVNGQVVSVNDVRWQETGAGIEGRLDYGATDTATGRCCDRARRRSSSSSPTATGSCPRSRRGTSSWRAVRARARWWCRRGSRLRRV